MTGRFSNGASESCGGWWWGRGGRSDSLPFYNLRGRITEVLGLLGGPLQRDKEAPCLLLIEYLRDESTITAEACTPNKSYHGKQGCNKTYAWRR